MSTGLGRMWAPGQVEQFLNLLAILARNLLICKKVNGINALYCQILCTESQKLISIR